MERGGQRGDVLVADVELAAGDMGQLGRSLQGISCIVAAEGGVEYPAVVDDIGHASCLAVGSAVGIEGILGLQVLDNADLALKAALMEGDDSLGEMCIRDRYVPRKPELPALDPWVTWRQNRMRTCSVIVWALLLPLTRTTGL